MELKWLEDFLSLADSGSFSRLAEQRHVSQPAFSRRIRALEAWLRVVLFDRSTFPTRLTAAGEAFKGPAADLINRLHGARALVRGHQAAAGDALVFAVPHTLAFAFFPAWLGRLKTDFGELPVRLVAGNVHDVATMLVEGGCDLLLCYHHPAQPVWLDPGRFEGLRLALEPVRPYLPRRLAGAAGWQLPGRPEGPIPFLRYGSNTYLRRMVDTILDRAARHLKLPIEGARVVVQGFGNVGGVGAQLFHEAGARVIAIADHSVALVNEAGIDIPAALEHAAAHGSLAGFGGAAVLDIEEFWRLECEFLVPAALEGQLTAERAAGVRARIIVEGANGPTTPAADDVLRERGILVVPDVLANAGGVTVSYFEWVQDFSSFFWTEDEINDRLERIMVGAFGAIWKVAQDKQVSLRTAAFIIACHRALKARAERGLYP